MNSIKAFAALACAIIPSLVAAQPAANAQTVGAGPPVRVLGSAISVTTELLVNPAQVRALPGGRVLVNDGTRRRLLLFDSTMKLIKVVADSVPTLKNAYGINPGKLLAFTGDSSLLLDSQTLSMLVIDGDGNIVKVKALPRSDHSTFLAGPSTAYGNPGFDAQGRLLYRIADPSPLSVLTAAGGGVIAPQMADSAPVLRMNLETRKLDTAGKVKIQKRSSIVTQSATGGMMIRSSPTNPMPTTDDWSVVSDGSLALLRNRDYSIDWLRPNGKWESTAPMPFDWQRLSDDHKKAFVDSIRTQLENSRRITIARYDSLNHMCFDTERTMGPEIPKETRAAFQAAAKQTVIDRAAATAAAARGPAAGRGRAATAGTTTIIDGRAVTVGPGVPAPVLNTSPLLGRVGGPPPTCPAAVYPPEAFAMAAPNIIEAKELPDYKPPFGANSMRADADGNLWIRVNQMKPIPGAYLFDIVNSKGELFDRIQMPVARTLVGFGPGNIVYTIARDAAGLKLERVRWK